MVLLLEIVVTPAARAAAVVPRTRNICLPLLQRRDNDEIARRANREQPWPSPSKSSRGPALNRHDTELWRPCWPDVAKGNRGGVGSLALPGYVLTIDDQATKGIRGAFELTIRGPLHKLLFLCS